MRINTNVSALNAWRGLTQTDSALGKSLEKLSSGMRINRAGDDAAGLAISEKMRGQIKGLNQAIRNAQDGISLIQTAEGALTETHSILQRMRELATQASNDTNTEADRGEIQKEINQLTSELNRIANTTEFNTQKLLNGEKGSDTSVITTAAALNFQIGANGGQSFKMNIADMRAAALGVAATASAAAVTAKSGLTASFVSGTGEVTDNGATAEFALDVSTHENATGAIDRINDAIALVSSERSKLGSFQNRLEHTIANLGVASENLSAAESRIRDVDMAAEIMNMTRQNILSQASTTMLAQANQRPQAVLQLLR